MSLGDTYTAFLSPSHGTHGTQVMSVYVVICMIAATGVALWDGGVVYFILVISSIDMGIFLSMKLLRTSFNIPEDLWTPIIATEVLTCVAYTSVFVMTMVVTTLKQTWNRQKENEQLKAEIESLIKQAKTIKATARDQKSNLHEENVLDCLGNANRTGHCNSRSQETETQVEWLKRDNKDSLTQLKPKEAEMNLYDSHYHEEMVRLQTEISDLRISICIVEERLEQNGIDHKAEVNRFQAEISYLRNNNRMAEEKLEKKEVEMATCQLENKVQVNQLHEEISGFEQKLNQREAELNICKVHHEEELSQQHAVILDLENNIHKAEESLQKQIEEANCIHDKHEAEVLQLRDEMAVDKEKLREQADQITHSQDLYEEHFSKLQEEITELKETRHSLENKLEKQEEDAFLKQERYKASISDLQERLSDLHNNLAVVTETFEKEKYELRNKYRREITRRRDCHNKLVELKGNIRVFARIRPPIEEDGIGPEVVVDIDPDDDGMVMVKGQPEPFEVDKVFPAAASQLDVFNEVQALVTSCIDGYNVCIFAYGQTGSGKTYTMEGTLEEPGINQRALKQLFEETGSQSDEWQYTITVSIIEIYMNRIRDLLCENLNQKLEVKMAQEGGHYLPGLTSRVVDSVEDIAKVLAVGRKNRQTASTKMNQQSSRSHVLLSIKVAGTNMKTDQTNIGKLNLVDLAGSERASKTGAEGDRLKEAQSINKSLFHLKEVIRALGNPEKERVNYRNSLLTKLLEDSLGGDSKTLMVVQVSPVEKNAGETTESLRFASNCRAVEIKSEQQQMPRRKKSTVKIAHKKSVSKSPNEPKKKQRERSVSVGPQGRYLQVKPRMKRLRSTSAGNSPEGSLENICKAQEEESLTLPPDEKNKDDAFMHRKNYKDVFTPSHTLVRDTPDINQAISMQMTQPGNHLTFHHPTEKSQNDILVQVQETTHSSVQEFICDNLGHDETSHCWNTVSSNDTPETFLLENESKPDDVKIFLVPRENAEISPAPTPAKLSEDEEIEAIMKGHDNLMLTMTKRSEMLQTIHGQWISGNVQSTIDMTVGMKNQEVLVDVLDVILQKPKMLDLNMCYTILPTMKELLNGKSEKSVGVAIAFLKLILRDFATVIKDNMTSSSSIGVDISGEERHQKCEKCHRILMEIRPVLGHQHPMYIQHRREMDLLNFLYLQLD